MADGSRGIIPSNDAKNNFVRRSCKSDLDLDLRVVPWRQIGKLASLLAVTVTPQKGTNVRLPVGGPCFVFWGSSSLFLFGSSSLRSRWVGGHRVLCVVPTAAVHVAVCKILGQTIVLPAVAGSAYCVCPGEARRFTSRARLGTWYFLGLRPSKSRSAAPTSEAARGRAMGLLTRRAWVPAFCDGAAISKLVQYNCSRRTSTE